MYIRKLVGERCYLSPIDLDDAPKYAEWLNDMEISRNLTLVTAQVSVHGEREALERLSKEHNYAIVDGASDELIGNCGLMDLDPLNRSAELGIFIGRRDFLGRGYGREALSLLLDYAFSFLNLENIMLRVYDFNERAIRCYEAVGFRRIGVRREALRRERTSHDEILMDILPSDFYGSGGSGPDGGPGGA